MICILYGLREDFIIEQWAKRSDCKKLVHQCAVHYIAFSPVGCLKLHIIQDLRVLSEHNMFREFSIHGTSTWGTWYYRTRMMMVLVNVGSNAENLKTSSHTECETFPLLPHSHMHLPQLEITIKHHKVSSTFWVGFVINSITLSPLINIHFAARLPFLCVFFHFSLRHIFHSHHGQAAVGNISSVPCAVMAAEVAQNCCSWEWEFFILTEHVETPFIIKARSSQQSSPCLNRK